jgi:hypothetical protein
VVNRNRQTVERSRVGTGKSFGVRALSFLLRWRKSGVSSPNFLTSLENARKDRKSFVLVSLAT